MRPPNSALTLAALVVLAAACTSNDSGAAERPLTITSTDDACDASASEAPSGNIMFEVINRGTQVTEVYLLADDGLRIIGEVENIGPGITRNLVVQVAAGQYIVECKPGRVGDGIRSEFTVTDPGA